MEKERKQEQLDLDNVLYSVAQARECLQGLDDGEEPVVSDADNVEAGEAETPAGAEQDAADTAASRSFDEGNVGLGVDIVEIERMRAIIERNPHFVERVFSRDERDYCDSKANAAAHYATRFAAKEAVVKALGTGFAQGIDVRDIEVARYSSGKPHALLSGRAREIAEEQGVRDLEISLSYTHTEAVACAMAVTESSVRAAQKRVDPMEELAKQFKEMRGMLDEI